MGMILREAMLADTMSVELDELSGGTSVYGIKSYFSADYCCSVSLGLVTLRVVRAMTRRPLGSQHYKNAVRCLQYYWKATLPEQ